MIPTIHLERDLKRIDTLYQQALVGPSSNLSKLYSKLSVLEVCNWTQECMEKLTLDCYRRLRLKEKSNIVHISNVIKYNNSISYDRHFRNLFVHVLGIAAFERIENRVDPSKKAKLKAALAHLKPERDSHAHTTIRSAASFSAPSLCHAQFQDIAGGLAEYEKFIRKVKISL